MAGWLGLLLGSRLYFRVTGEVLGDAGRYEALVDDIAQEVRRRAPNAGGAGITVPTGGSDGDSGEAGGEVQSVAPPAQPSAPTTTRPSASGHDGGGVVLTISSSIVNHSTVSGDTTNIIFNA